MDKKHSILQVPFVSNPFFHQLSNELQKIGHTICTNSDKFSSSITNFDILHIHFPEFLCNKLHEVSKSSQHAIVSNYRNRLKRFCDSGTRIIWTVHNLKTRSKYKDIENELFNATIEFSHGIITPSDLGKDILLKEYPHSKNHKIAVIPHGNYIGVYPESFSREQARSLLNINDNEIVLLYFGLLRSYKNPTFVINAFKHANKINKNLRLLIVGKPFSLKTKLYLFYIDKFKQHIQVAQQYIPEQDVHIYFNASDIGIFAFNNSYMSGAVILAESFGLPIIAPALGSLPDYIDKSFGWTYIHNNLDDLTNKIRLAAKSDLKTMGNKAREFQKIYTWENIAKTTSDFYSSLF